jgi:hypothetical protein
MDIETPLQKKVFAEKVTAEKSINFHIKKTLEYKERHLAYHPPPPPHLF